MTDVQTRSRDLTDLDADILALRHDRAGWHPEHGSPVSQRMLQQVRVLIVAANEQYGLPFPTVDASHTGDVTLAWHVPPHGHAGGETDMTDCRLNLFTIDCTPGNTAPAQFASIRFDDPAAAEVLTRFVAAV